MQEIELGGRTRAKLALWVNSTPFERRDMPQHCCQRHALEEIIRSTKHTVVGFVNMTRYWERRIENEFLAVGARAEFSNPRDCFPFLLPQQPPQHQEQQQQEQEQTTK